MSTQLVSEKRIIGGLFGVPEALDRANNGPFFMDDSSILLVNARSGLHLTAKAMSPPQVWMPSYVSGSAITACEKAGRKVSFYPVDQGLRVSSTDWLDKIKKGDFVILIDYFGFPYDRSIAVEAKSKGAVIIEDASQALLSTHVGESSDIILFSPRNFVGVPDGGLLNLRNGFSIGNVKLTLPPQKWWGKALCAGVGRSEFDRMGGSRRWSRLHQEVEEECPIGRYAMSALARNLLIHGFDYKGASVIRKENYAVLLEMLGDAAIFPHPDDNTVPLGFPIRVTNRDHLQETLLAEDIFLINHWAVKDIVPAEYAESHQLADEILILPCDQRYGREDMERIADVLCTAGFTPAAGPRIEDMER